MPLSISPSHTQSIDSQLDQEPALEADPAYPCWASSAPASNNLKLVDMTAALKQGFQKLGIALENIPANKNFIVERKSDDQKHLEALFHHKQTQSIYDLIQLGTNEQAFRGVMLLIDLELINPTVNTVQYGPINFATYLIASNPSQHTKQTIKPQITIQKRLAALKTVGCDLNESMIFAIKQKLFSAIATLEELGAQADLADEKGNNVLHLLSEHVRHTNIDDYTSLALTFLEKEPKLFLETNHAQETPLQVAAKIDPKFPVDFIQRLYSLTYQSNDKDAQLLLEQLEHPDAGWKNECKQAAKHFDTLAFWSSRKDTASNPLMSAFIDISPPFKNFIQTLKVEPALAPIPPEQHCLIAKSSPILPDIETLIHDGKNLNLTDIIQNEAHAHRMKGLVHLIKTNVLPKTAIYNSVVPVSLVEILLSACEEPNAFIRQQLEHLKEADCSLEEALPTAITKQNLSVIRLLADAGASLDITMKDGNNLMHVLCYKSTEFSQNELIEEIIGYLKKNVFLLTSINGEGYMAAEYIAPHHNTFHTQLINKLKHEADSGDSTSQCILGVFAQQGFVIHRNTKLAFQYFTRSAQQKDPQGHYCLGLAYFNGEGTAVNLELAGDHLTAAALLGHTRAQIHLGISYLTGKTEEGVRAAGETFNAAAKQANQVVAVFHLSQMVNKLLPDGKINPEVNCLLSRAAIQGSPDAQLAIAKDYEAQVKQFLAKNPNKTEDDTPLSAGAKSWRETSKTNRYKPGYHYVNLHRSLVNYLTQTNVPKADSFQSLNGKFIAEMNTSEYIALHSLLDHHPPITADQLLHPNSEIAHFHAYTQLAKQGLVPKTVLHAVLGEMNLPLALAHAYIEDKTGTASKDTLQTKFDLLKQAGCSLTEAMAHAIATNNLQCIDSLLLAGADPSTTDQFGNTTLHAYCRWANDITQAEFFQGVSKGLAKDVFMFIQKNNEGEAPCDIARSFNPNFEKEFAPWIEQSDYAKHTWAQYLLGMLYQRRKGNLPPSAVKSFHHFRHVSVDVSNLRLQAYALYHIGVAHLNGRGAPRKDVHSAINLFKAAAQEGLAMAEVRLGQIYLRHPDIKPDLKQAKLWFNRAAEKGNTTALQELEVLNT